VVLAVAGSDSGGGAGLQADLRTMGALGCYGLSVVTAVTAQNSRAIRAVSPVPARVVRAQLDAVLEDMGADAVKIGMLGTAANVRETARALRDHRATNVVLDPVLRATIGTELLPPAAIALVERLLFPLVTLVTPNIPEAEALLGRRVAGARGVEAAARELVHRGARAVLIKGGHGAGPARDVFTDGRRVLVFEAPRLAVRHTHGSGCVLSTAIACLLALGFPLEEALTRGKAFITEAIRGAFPVGSGNGPVNPEAAGRALAGEGGACRR
jgi:hydroxymethylpyrimidine/phosphomethylpyrimidine kinase